MSEPNLTLVEFRMRIEDALAKAGFKTVTTHAAGALLSEPGTADLDIEVELHGGRRGRFRVVIDHAAVVDMAMLDAAESEAATLAGRGVKTDWNHPLRRELGALLKRYNLRGAVLLSLGRDDKVNINSSGENDPYGAVMVRLADRILADFDDGRWDGVLEE